VTAGGGTAPSFSRSDNDGIAVVPWTFGSASAQQALTATAGTSQVTTTGTATTSGNRTPVAQIPGSVMDADETRILWQGLVAPRDGGVWVRRRGTTVDSLITRTFVSAGRLFSDGVVMIRTINAIPQGEILVSRNGTVTTVSSADPNYPLLVEGDWAAWRIRSSVWYWARHNLRTGRTDTLTTANYQQVDIGSSGDFAAINQANGAVVVFRADGTVATTGQGATSLMVVGPDVFYTTLNGAAIDPQSAWLDQPGPDLLLATPVREAVYGGAGWLGFTRQALPTGSSANVFRRRPDGTIEQITFDTWNKRVEAVSPTGWVLFRASVGGVSEERWYLSVPGRPLVIDVGPYAGNERAVWRTDRFLLLSQQHIGGTAYGFVYELTP
jgi:hypothetical protein